MAIRLPGEFIRATYYRRALNSAGRFEHGGLDFHCLLAGKDEFSTDETLRSMITEQTALSIETTDGLVKERIKSGDRIVVLGKAYLVESFAYETDNPIWWIGARELSDEALKMRAPLLITLK